MAYVDFQDVKQRVSIEDAAKKLGLVVKIQGAQFRSACPTCKAGGDRALVITPSKNAFYCFQAKKGGDQIALVAHIRECSVRDAALWLSGKETTGTSNSTRSTSQTVPESEGGQQGARILQPLSYLQADHELVVALGFDTEFCRKHGIGYAAKGLMRGHVAIPFRSEDGILLGYIGVEGDVKLPADFTPNVVPFKRAV